MDARLDQTPRIANRVCHVNGWPREVVVEHGDGTVSLLANVSFIEGVVRGRRAGDVFREVQS
jgi:hypothetical protein